MKRKTKTTRHQKIIREYQRRFPGAVAVNAVVEWAISRKLLPVPGRLAVEIDAAAVWDERFAKIEREIQLEECDCVLGDRDSDVDSDQCFFHGKFVNREGES